jgi:type I restriction enzyme M protein
MDNIQRDQLHKTIWRIANELRGSVDGWDFKQYVLGFLFYRFISENLTNYINTNQIKTGQKGFDFAKLDDKKANIARKETVAEKGFYILPSELFPNVKAKASEDPNLNETLSRIFKNIEASAVGTPSELDLKGLFDDLDINSNKLGPTVVKRNERLVKLLNAVGDLELGDYSSNTIDAFGDAYEYLMTMYASSAGKSGGEFFTPQEVSELLARITLVGKKTVNKVYDPACGSGSLLLQYAKVLGKDKVLDGFYGQEINITTYNLCRINMFLHDINYEKFSIAHGDTLTDPYHWDDQPFEAIVSNPPYSIDWDGDANPLMINDPRFSPAGVLAPKSKADLAFTMHILHWLATNGTAAIVEFPGVLYRGGAELKIRQYLVDNNYVDAVIQLPKDLFFGTGIQTCILVLKKSRKESDVQFVNAEREFARFGNKNKLRPEDISTILKNFKERKDVDYFSRVVSHEEIKKNKYLLSVSTYVTSEDTREKIDITSLETDIDKILARQLTLRKSLSLIISDLKEDQNADYG